MKRIMESPVLFAHKVYSDSVCDRIIEEGKNLLIESAGVNVKEQEEYTLDQSYRQTEVGFFPKTNWVSELVQTAVYHANTGHYQAHLTDCEHVQFGIYNEGAFYKAHRDYDLSCNHLRKMSITIQLTDPSEYEGGDFVLWDFYGNEQRNELWRGRGSILVFPSVLKHEVTKVTKGTRMSLVQWHSGPDWR